MKFVLKQRSNPQSGIYYSPMGAKTDKEIKDMNKSGSLYGSNLFHIFETEDEYLSTIEQLKSDGERVL